MNLSNVIPLPREEQMFAGKTLLTGFMNGVLANGFIITGSVLFVTAVLLTIRTIRQRRGRNPHVRFLLIELLGLSILSLGLAFLSGLSKAFVGFAIDTVTILSQLINVVAMIIDNPSNWWRYLLLVVPALFLPKFIRNLFQKKPWHFSSIGKIFGNMFAGAAITALSFPILFITGKSKRQRQIEDNPQDASKIIRRK